MEGLGGVVERNPAGAVDERRELGGGRDPGHETRCGSGSSSSSPSSVQRRARWGVGHAGRRSRERMRVGVDVVLGQRLAAQAERHRGLVEPPAAEEARGVRHVERAQLGCDHLRDGQAELARRRARSRRRRRRSSRPPRPGRRAPRAASAGDRPRAAGRARRESGRRSRRGTPLSDVGRCRRSGGCDPRTRRSSRSPGRPVEEPSLAPAARQRTPPRAPSTTPARRSAPCPPRRRARRGARRARGRRRARSAAGGRPRGRPRRRKPGVREAPSSSASDRSAVDVEQRQREPVRPDDHERVALEQLAQAARRRPRRDAPPQASAAARRVADRRQRPAATRRRGRRARPGRRPAAGRAAIVASTQATRESAVKRRNGKPGSACCRSEKSANRSGATAPSPSSRAEATTSRSRGTYVAE